jgi:hypothetical protein
MICYKQIIITIAFSVLLFSMYYYHGSNGKQYEQYKNDKTCPPCIINKCAPCPVLHHSQKVRHRKHHQDIDIEQQQPLDIEIRQRQYQPIDMEIEQRKPIEIGQYDYMTGLNYADPVYKADQISLKDALIFPEQRLNRDELYMKNMALRTGMIGNFTSGFPDTPKLYGYLYENMEEIVAGHRNGPQCQQNVNINVNTVRNRRVLPLLGYETYPNSRQFKYYTILNDVGVNMQVAPKIEIEFKMNDNGRLQRINKRELYGGDIVQMNTLDCSLFTVKMLGKDDIRF